MKKTSIYKKIFAFNIAAIMAYVPFGLTQEKPTSDSLFEKLSNLNLDKNDARADTLSGGECGCSTSCASGGASCACGCGCNGDGGTGGDSGDGCSCAGTGDDGGSSCECW